jgi:SAM-dependent methyltransferase
VGERKSNEWNDHAEWWLGEVATDPIYRSDVLPLAAGLLRDVSGRVLELGCGEGQAMAVCAGGAIGCDISLRLLRQAAGRGPVVRAELPDLEWLRSDVLDGAYMVLVLEHLADLQIFAAAARVVRPGGKLVLVMNHPAFTAEGAGPIIDSSDGEILWRWGRYFERGETLMPASGSTVTFHHRPLPEVLNAAATAGWCLEELVETGLSNAAIATEPEYVGQEEMPRLLGARWMNTQGGRVFGR